MHEIYRSDDFSPQAEITTRKHSSYILYNETTHLHHRINPGGIRHRHHAASHRQRDGAGQGYRDSGLSALRQRRLRISRRLASQDNGRARKIAQAKGERKHQGVQGHIIARRL